MSQPAKPVILAVDDDPQVLRAICRDLRSAYAESYRILGCSSAQEALELLDTVNAKGHDLALLLADQRMPDMTGSEFLLEAESRLPGAKRMLLTAYADTDAAITAINEIRLDYYMMKPWDPPQDRLYPVLNDLLSDWRAQHRPAFEGIRVVGRLRAATTHMVRDFLTRNEQAFQFLDVETRQEAVRLAGLHPEKDLPLVIFPGGDVLSAPLSGDLAERLGLATVASRPHYDTVIIGAGPAGLAAAVYSASEGLSTLLIDSDVPGGQAGTSSHIVNYLGFPAGLSGTDLARRAMTQARRFGAELLYPTRVVRLRQAGSARIVTFGDGTEVSAEAVLLATGISYNRLQVPGAESFENTGLYYGAAATESESCAEQTVFVVGGANSAGQAAIHFAKFASSVTMVVRAASLEASMSRYLVNEIRRIPSIKVRPSTRIIEFRGGERLEHVVLRDDRTGEETVAPAPLVFSFIGGRPNTEWLDGVVERDAHGFVVTGPDLVHADKPASSWGLPRPPYLLETSMPGVFAAGDVRAGSVKRVAAGVGEGAMAVALIHRYRTDAVTSGR